MNNSNSFSKQSSSDKLVTHYSFLLIDGFSMLTFTGAIETLRIANNLSGINLYHWTIASLTGEPVTASNGIEIKPNHKLGDLRDVEGIFLCSGSNLQRTDFEPYKIPLRSYSNMGVKLCGLYTGTYVLAKLGFLKGYRSVIHWDSISSFREEFPEQIITDEIFTLDRNRISSGGGLAPIYLMLYLIKQKHGGELVNAVSEMINLNVVRNQNEKQRPPITSRLKSDNPLLHEAVSIMESNIEEPICIIDIADLLDISLRQLERIFKKDLRRSPRSYYIELRLHRARQMVLQTSLEISRISIACGFNSFSNFAKVYRAFFGNSPRSDRSMNI